MCAMHSTVVSKLRVPELLVAAGYASSGATGRARQPAIAVMTMGRDHGGRWNVVDLEVSMQTVLMPGCKAFGGAPNTACQSFCTTPGTLTSHKACSASAVKPGRVQRA